MHGLCFYPQLSLCEPVTWLYLLIPKHGCCGGRAQPVRYTSWFGSCHSNQTQLRFKSSLFLTKTNCPACIDCARAGLASCLEGDQYCHPPDHMLVDTTIFTEKKSRIFVFHWGKSGCTYSLVSDHNPRDLTIDLAALENQSHQLRSISPIQIHDWRHSLYHCQRTLLDYSTFSTPCHKGSP